MKLFWPLYLSTAVIGSVAVYYVAPRLSPLPESAPAVKGKNESGAENGAAACSAAAQASVVKTTAEEEMPLEPPSALGIYIARENESSVWGVTKRETGVYTQTGERKGVVRGGILLSFRSLQPSSKGDMAVCSFLNDTNATPRVYLLKRTDTVLFTGDYTRLESEQLDMIRKYYELRGRIEKKRKTLLVTEAEKNPFFHEYRQRYNEYATMTKEAKWLEKKREGAEGELRTRLIEELAALRQREAVLNKRLMETRKAYTGWKAAHADIDEIVERNPEIMRWRTELEVLRRQIPGLAI